MSALPPENRIEPENLHLYSTNLEVNSSGYFNPASPMDINTDAESQNYTAVKASELKDHLLQMLTQKQAPSAIDDITSIADEGSSVHEIRTGKEKEEPVIDHPQTFRDKKVNEHNIVTFAKLKSTQKSKNNKKNSYESIMEQDGLYIPKEIKAKNKNVERITYRLNWNAKDSEKYFDVEGKLKNDAPVLRKIPPPFKEDPILPPYYNSKKSQLLPATTWGLENSTTAREIRVEVNSVQFTVHHLSSDEDILTLRMKQLYISYLHTVQYPRSNYFATRIKALRRDLKQHSENRAKILTEIIDCHKMRDQEEFKTRMKLEQLLVTWHELKDLRTKNGYTTTNAALRWQSKKYTEDQTVEEQQTFDKAIKKRASEICQLASLQPNAEETLELDRVIADITQEYKDMGLRMPGDPIWRPIIYEIDVTPETSLPESVIDRRKLLNKARVYVAFMMGTTEMRSNDTMLNNQFVAPIDTGCKASTMRVPHDVRIHIYEYGDMKLNEMATVAVPVMNGIPKEFVNYEFAAESKTQSGLIVQGYISARVFIEPDTVATQTVLPDVRSVAPVRTQISNRFLSVPKYLEIVSKHDPNDPYIAAAIGSVMAESNEQTIYNRFAIDVAKDSTKFESMAPSNLCEVIHKKAYDKLYGESERPEETTTPKLQLEDVVKDAPKATFDSFFTSLWQFLTFRRGQKTKYFDKSVPSHRLEPHSVLSLCITGFSNLPEEVTNANAKITFDDNVVETKMYDIRAKHFLGSAEDFRPPQFNPSRNDNVIQGMNFQFTLSKSKIAPHFSQIEDKTVRIDVFDSIEERYIASIEIPLRSIFVNGKISGEYSLFYPPFNLGYTKNNLPMRIKMSLELSPLLLPPNFVDQNVCSEKPNVAKRARMISEKYYGSRRRIVPLATTQTDDTLLPCRFILAQKPPEGYTDIHNLLSFVSILPTAADSAMPGADNQQWSTSQQFLNDARGTSTEHAILLCNFLKYLEKDAYVILGHDAITGLCAFVGIRESSNGMQILDPVAGREVELEKEFSTLMDIGTVFNDRNVWFNSQKVGKVAKISWNFNDSGKWLPFFCRDFPRYELTSPQEIELHFEESPVEHAEALQKYVESVLIDSTEILRDDRQTEWDEEYSEMLQKVLSASAKGESEKLTNALQNLEREKDKKTQLIGSPFFIAYVYDEDNIDKLRTGITEELKSHEVYDCNKKKVRFAHAVEITSFPSDVYGIWILLTAVIPGK